MLEHYLEAGSSYAQDIDNLILLVTLITAPFFLLAQGLLFFFVVKFSAKEGVKAQYIAGESWKQKRWVSVPHYAVLVFDVWIIIAAIQLWVNIKQTIPQTDETVRIISQQWAWTFVHAGPDGKMDTPDDIRTIDELHVELGRTYEYELQSRDVLHSFSVPVFRLKQDALPGRTIKGWFKPIITGGFDIQCTEICGIGHGIMAARIIIETPADHAAWVKAHAPVAAAVVPATPEPSPAHDEHQGEKAP